MQIEVRCPSTLHSTLDRGPLTPQPGHGGRGGRVTAVIIAVVPQIDPSVPQPVVQSRRRPLLGPSPG